MKKLILVFISIVYMHVLTAQNEWLQFHDRIEFKLNQLNYSGNQFDNVEPGILPEADLPYKVEYSPDGQKLIVIFHHTDNMIIYDTELYEPLATIDVGAGPIDFDVVGDHIYVCCHYSSDVYVVNIENFAIENIYEVDPNPCVISVKNNEELMYLGFTGEPPYRYDGYIAAWVLTDYNRLWQNSEVMIAQQSDDGSWGRVIYSISDFLLIGNDQYIVCDRNAGSHLLILNSINGQIDSLIYNSGKAISYTASPGEDTLYLLTSVTDSLKFFCIDAFTLNTLDQLTIPVSGTTSFSRWQDNLSVNGDGTKMFIETRVFPPENFSYLVDLQNDAYKVIQPEGMIFNMSRRIQSFDRRYVIVPGPNLRIFDFETEEYVYETSDFLKYYNNLIAASPVEYKFVYSDHGFNIGGYFVDYDEYFEVNDFSNPQNPEVTDSIFCGEQPEADMVYSADINYSCNKLITANPLSRNVSIIDYSSYDLDTLLEFDYITSVKSLPGDLIAMTGHRNPKLYFFDLSTLSIVKHFTVEGLINMTLSPDNEYLYALSRWLGKMVKIHLDGPNSELIDSIEVKIGGASYMGMDWTYYPELTPDGNYFLAYDDDTARIISTELMEIVADVPTCGITFHDVAYTGDSKRACLTSRQYVEIIYIDGVNSFLEHTIEVGLDNRSVAVEYNDFDQRYYLATNDTVLIIDPVNGLIEDTLDFSVKDQQIQIDFDHKGGPIIRTLHYLYYNGQEFQFRETTKNFFVDYTNKKCIIPSPGPDKVYILDLLTTEIEEIVNGQKGSEILIYPNPASEILAINSKDVIDRVEIFEMNGKMMYAKKYDTKNATINVGDLPEGIYIVSVMNGNERNNKRLLIFH